MIKKFYLDRIIDLPEISVHCFGEKKLYILKSNASWIVLDSINSQIFEMMYSRKKLGEIIYEVSRIFSGNVEKAVKIIQDLLKKLSCSYFLNNPPKINESPTVHFYLTNKCNLVCIHCYMNAGKELPEELSEKDIKLFFKNLANIIGPTIVSLSGGEPLTKKEFFNIVPYIKELGNRIVLITNGTLIDKDTAKKLEKLVDIVQLSLDGITEEVNDSIRGDGTYRKVVRALDYLTDTSLKIYLSFTVMPKNKEDLLENLVNFLEKFKGKVTPLIGSMLMEGRGKHCENFCESELRFVISELKLSLFKAGWNIGKTKIKGIKRENCFYKTLVINSNGDVYPCPVMINDFLFGNIKKEKNLERFFERWYNAEKNTRVDKIEKCKDCDLMYICGGGCRIKNFEKNRDLLISSCQESDKEKIYLELINYDLMENERNNKSRKLN